MANHNGDNNVNDIIGIKQASEILGCSSSLARKALEEFNVPRAASIQVGRGVSQLYHREQIQNVIPRFRERQGAMKEKMRALSRKNAQKMFDSGKWTKAGKMPASSVSARLEALEKKVDALLNYWGVNENAAQ